MSSNLHGFSEFSRERGNPSNQFSMMGANLNSGDDPRNENFWSFMKNFCCPTFVFKSVIFVISIIDVIIYLITISFGLKMSPYELLAPKIETLDSFGMKNPLKMQQGQIWRFLTFGFLHANLMHLVFNLFSQILMGSYVETMIGSVKISGLYLLSGIGGGIFSCLVSNANGVGASISIFGMLGAYVGLTIMNWNYLDRVMGSGKYFNLFFILFIVFINISFGFSNPIIDNNGHIGGLICGFFLIFILHRPNEPNDGMCCSHKIWFWISAVVIAMFYIGGLILFYTVRRIN